LSAENVRTSFIAAVRERRKYTNRQKYYRENKLESGASFEIPLVDLGSMHVLDMAIVRYKYDPLEVMPASFERVITETEFARLMDSYKPGAKEWRAIECIQTCVKARFGSTKQQSPSSFRSSNRSTRRRS